MSADRVRKIDHEVTEIHSRIKRANLVLRQRMKKIQQDMETWTLLDSENESGEEGNTLM